MGMSGSASFQSASLSNDRRSPLKPRVNLLPPSLNCCLNRGLLCGESVGQVEFSFHDPIRLVFLDGELCRELAVLQLGQPYLDDISLVPHPALHDCCNLLGFNYCTLGVQETSSSGGSHRALSSPPPRRSTACISY